MLNTDWIERLRVDVTERLHCWGYFKVKRFLADLEKLPFTIDHGALDAFELTKLFWH